MVEPARDDLPGWVLEQLGDGLHHDGEDLLAVLLDPALLGVPNHLVAPRFSYRLQALVEQGRLDSGRPFVDTQHEFLAHPLTLTSISAPWGSTLEVQSAGMCAERPGISRGSRPCHSVFPRWATSSRGARRKLSERSR